MNVVGTDIITKVARLHSGTFTCRPWDYLDPELHDVFASYVGMYQKIQKMVIKTFKHL